MCVRWQGAAGWGRGNFATFQLAGGVICDKVGAKLGKVAAELRQSWSVGAQPRGVAGVRAVVCEGVHHPKACGCARGRTTRGEDRRKAAEARSTAKEGRGWCAPAVPAVRWRGVRPPVVEPHSVQPASARARRPWHTGISPGGGIRYSRLRHSMRALLPFRGLW